MIKHLKPYSKLVLLKVAWKESALKSLIKISFFTLLAQITVGIIARSCHAPSNAKYHVMFWSAVLLIEIILFLIQFKKLLNSHE